MPLAYDDARQLLREADADLAEVRSWPPDRPQKPEWERACYSRREAMRKLVKALAAGPTERHEAERLTATR